MSKGFLLVGEPMGLFIAQDEGTLDCVDYFRKGSAASTLTVADIDTIGLTSYSHLHMTGILPALSQSCLNASRRLMQRARTAGLYLSFDPNLRPNLWPSRAAMVTAVNDLASWADLVLPGIDEGEMLMGSRDPKAIAEFYLQHGTNEVTFRTPQAAECIRRMAAEVPDILVGAGTVHDVETAALAVQSGAKFIVTAGFNEPVVDWCIASEIDVFPGCVTPTDLERLWLKGLRVANFFPAEAYGGVKVLKAFAGSYADIRFMPTGGITPANVQDYLSLSSVIACGGAWMAPEQLVVEGRFEEITLLCEKAVAL